MKLILAGAALAAFPFVAPPVQSVLQPVPTEIGLPQRSLLGNGGLESWSHGAQVQGPIAPDLWYAMGVPTNAFGQSDIAYTRVPEDAGCSASGPWCAEVRANAPGNYIAQRLEDFAGLEDRWVTFSVDLRTPFATASPTIAIDDGVNATTRTEIVGTSASRVTVRHRVSACATRLEFRVYPEQTVRVDHAMAVVGRHAEALYVPRRNVEPGLMELPLGAVVDWHRFDASIPVPEGFAICDGALVADADSPFVGKPTPNLASKFVRGVTSLGAIGSTGGADSVDLAHTHTGTTGSNQGPGGVDYWVMGNPQLDHVHNAKDGHVHTFTTNSSLGSVSTLPSYVGLLKLIRIK